MDKSRLRVGKCRRPWRVNIPGIEGGKEIQKAGEQSRDFSDALRRKSCGCE